MLKSSFILIILITGLFAYRAGESSYFLSASAADRVTSFTTKKYHSNEMVNIRIFSQLKMQSFTFSPDAGIYSVWANGNEIVNTAKFPIIKFSYSNDSIEVKTFENIIGKFKRIKISSGDEKRSFRLKLISPD